MSIQYRNLLNQGNIRLNLMRSSFIHRSPTIKVGGRVVDGLITEAIAAMKAHVDEHTRHDQLRQDFGSRPLVYPLRTSEGPLQRPHPVIYQLAFPIWDWMFNWAQSPEPGVNVVAAPSSFGKSAACTLLRACLPSTVGCLYVPDKEASRPGGFAKHMARSYGNGWPEALMITGGEFPLASIILIDGMDTVDEEDLSSIDYLMRVVSDTPRAPVVLITTRSEECAHKLADMNGGTKIFHAPGSSELNPEWALDHLRTLTKHYAADAPKTNEDGNLLRSGHRLSVSAQSALKDPHFESELALWDNPAPLKTYLEKMSIPVQRTRASNLMS